MKIFLAAHNINSAGITTQTQNLIAELRKMKENNFIITLPDSSEFHEYKDTSSKNLKIYFFPYSRNIFLRYLYRFLTDFIFIPTLVLFTNPTAVVSLANYFPFPIIFRKKIILIRHPYLLNDNLFKNISFKAKINEYLARGVLKGTLLTTDEVIVQSEYMRDLFIKAFGKKYSISILPNPLSSTFVNNGIKKTSVESISNSSVFFYPSRFYRHKNHRFLIELSKKYYQELKDLKIKIKVTIAPDPRYYRKEEKQIIINILNEINNTHLKDVIENLGEMPQADLNKVYKKSKGIIFPSSEETFGNSLIEGMYFGLPMLVPRLPYAQIICGNAGCYYEPDNVDSAFNNLKEIVKNETFCNRYKDLSYKRFKKFISTDLWIEKLLKIAGGKK